MKYVDREVILLSSSKEHASQYEFKSSNAISVTKEVLVI
jgi:hypothetical protein